MLSLAGNRIRSVVGAAIGLVLLNPWGSLSHATDRPDFVVTSLSDPPASALPGDSFTLDVVVTNQGLAPAVATSSVTQVSTKFYLVAGTTNPRFQSGIRYSPTKNVDWYVIYGRNLTGEQANWITLALTFRIGDR